MRPESLNPAFTDVAALKGCGDRLAGLVEKLTGSRRLVDLWFLWPTGLIDRRLRPKVAAAPEGQVCTIAVRVGEVVPPATPRRPWRVLCADETGALEVIYFHGRQDHLAKLFPVGETVLVSGLLERYNGEARMPHPDFVVRLEQAETLPLLQPVYPLVAGLAPRTLLKLMDQALARLPDLPEWIDGPLRQQRRWPAWREALRAVHAPQTRADTAPETLARERLAYDELLSHQLALLIGRAAVKRPRAEPVHGDGRLRNPVQDALPWRLTAAQTAAVAEIAADLASGQRMNRLLQGDVGSGKTVVALLAMLIAVEAGGQAALMAPTEILAQQHAEGLARLAAPAGVRLALLTGSVPKAQRERLRTALAAGEIDLVVGTHALFQDGVQFHNLMLAVIDEQHRFGVQQRMALSGRAHTLVMTATPIPRTMALTTYGDMDISALREKPPGRAPIDTRALPLDRMDDVVAAAGRRMEQGGRVYWVCPLVEESAVIDVAAAEDRARHLRAVYGDRVGLLHGRQKSAEKERAMADFTAGRTSLMVATTVIEVGVDVPEATLIVIEHAERFGLAQLHQLRGRVGRGGHPGACILLYQSPLGETARARLNILRETDDGFLLAEEDMRLRGVGDVIGTRQSGLPDFRLAQLPRDAGLLDLARQQARLALERDPSLKGSQAAAYRVLLYLFERDAAIRYLLAA